MITPLDLKLRHLTALRAIRRTGSVSRAAEAVFLSQPAVTQALRNLEQRLGATLFDRHPGGMTPTALGRLFLDRADRAATHLEAAAASLAGPGTPAQEPLVRAITAVHLRSLLAVVAHGGFAPAARAAGLSQPALHRAARELERLFGTPMLLRQGRSVRPTPAAEAFVRHAELAVAELATGLDEVAAGRGEGAGRIAIGAMPLARAWLLPRAISRVHAETSGMSFRVVEGPYAELLDSLRSGELDCLIGALRDPAPAGDVLQELLFADQAVIVGCSHHPLAGPGQPSMAALRTFPWIIPGLGVPLRRQWETLFSADGEAPPRVTVECSSVLAIHGLLLEGDWLTLLSPTQIRREREAGRLTVIGAPVCGAARRIGVTTRRDWRPTTAQQRFMAVLRELSKTLRETE